MKRSEMIELMNNAISDAKANNIDDIRINAYVLYKMETEGMLPPVYYKELDMVCSISGEPYKYNQKRSGWEDET